MNQVSISAPGRICLFGEHQDYLGLPVIPMAIDLRVEMKGNPRQDTTFNIDLPDIGERQMFSFEERELVYTQKRDYFRSCLNVLFRNGYSWKHGWNCTVKGNIPINSGTSSSSALNNVWCKFLIEVSDQGDKSISNAQIGYFNYLAEVVEFQEAGGMMDQYSTAMGNILFLEFEPTFNISEIKHDLGFFVLGDSYEPKDTQKILSSTKAPALSAMIKIKEKYPEKSFHDISISELREHRSSLTSLEYQVMTGMICNRDITYRALQEFKKNTVDRPYLGILLSEHQHYLDKNLQISTPKINRMIEASLRAGALGAKINGSGGGGCMFAYAPDNPEIVAEAIIKEGAKAYIIQTGAGLRSE